MFTYAERQDERDLSPRAELSDDELAELEEQACWALEVQSQVALWRHHSRF